MEPQPGLIVALEDAARVGNELTGSKARNLSRIMGEGFRVPEGFCISTMAYQKFLRKNKLFQVIDQELSRKASAEMRWEEIWDASLRIRSAFLKAPLNDDIHTELLSWLQKYNDEESFSVRSSSPAEDSMKTSYAGIHDSYVNISGMEKIIEAVKLVWASLWTDRAILYREELSLDPLKSSMAVVIQRMEKRPVSGLAFTQDPTLAQDNMIIQAVGGLLSRLVDNVEEGEKWVIQRADGEVVDHYQPVGLTTPLLSPEELQGLVRDLLRIDEIFTYPVDVEWTGTGREFTVLQVRPITSLKDHNQERQWYLTLTPHFQQLQSLADRVEGELIPQLTEEGTRLSTQDTSHLSRMELARELERRALIYQKWKDIYWEEFIPFAHGIRNLGTYYNDLVKPDHPYEFLEIFKKQELLARERDEDFHQAAQILRDSSPQQEQVKTILNEGFRGEALLKEMAQIPSLACFLESFKELLDNHLDVSYQDQSLQSYPEIILDNLYHLSQQTPRTRLETSSDDFQEKLYQAAGESRREEVTEVLRIGRLSWKLRDDDNLLLGRVENQFLKILHQAVDILKKESRLEEGVKISPSDWPLIHQALLDEIFPLDLTPPPKEKNIPVPGFKPRQLVGQPSSPGMATGRARVITSLDDFSQFQSGEIMVCDAVEPQMTFLASLAAGIVERRGGMLVHSSIIARELGIPAVNGVSRATEILKNGDLLTVNGYLGLVVVGEPEFDLELQDLKRSGVGKL